LQKRPVILRSLLLEASPSWRAFSEEAFSSPRILAFSEEAFSSPRILAFSEEAFSI